MTRYFYKFISVMCFYGLIKTNLLVRILDYPVLLLYRMKQDALADSIFTIIIRLLDWFIYWGLPVMIVYYFVRTMMDLGEKKHTVRKWLAKIKMPRFKKL